MEQLNKIFTKHIDEGRFPGIQWQINIKDKIYSGKIGYNNIETKDPVLDNTIYRIWSMTKPVVAVAALQLLEQTNLAPPWLYKLAFYGPLQYRLLLKRR